MLDENAVALGAEDGLDGAQAYLQVLVGQGVAELAQGVRAVTPG